MRTILLIEDDADTIEMLTVFLEKCGYKVAAADNGIDGLTMVKFLKPDCIVVDLMLPGIDGRNLVLQLRENIYMKNKMIVVMSGMFPKNYNGQKIDDLDVQAVFSKPINLKKLQETIESFFSTNR